MKFCIQYTEIIEAKDNSEAKRIAIQTYGEGHNLTIFSLDEAGYIKGRIF